MDINDYHRMKSAADEKRERELEQLRERSARREGLLSRAIQTQRVTVDLPRQEREEPEESVRGRFTQDMAQRLNRAAGPTEAELLALLEE